MATTLDLNFTPEFTAALQNDPIVCSHVASWRIAKGAYSRDEMLQRLVVTLSQHADEMFNLHLQDMQNRTPHAATPQE